MSSSQIAQSRTSLTLNMRVNIRSISMLLISILATHVLFYITMLPHSLKHINQGSAQYSALLGVIGDK